MFTVAVVELVALALKVELQILGLVKASVLTNALLAKFVDVYLAESFACEAGVPLK